MNAALIGLGAFTVFTVAAYFYYVRPVLKRVPALSVLWEREHDVFAVIKARFAGIKTFLAVGVGQAAVAVVFLYDDMLPYATGIDFSPITGKVPQWAWPLILLFWFYVIGKCRQWTDDRQGRK